jgi:hypothetical protein
MPQYYTNCCNAAGLAINAVANARAHGFEHVIVIANDKAECGKLIKLSKGALDSCAWQNTKPLGQPNDPWWSGANKLAIRLGIRHYFMWRLLQKVCAWVLCRVERWTVYLASEEQHTVRSRARPSRHGKQPPLPPRPPPPACPAPREVTPVD